MLHIIGLIFALLPVSFLFNSCQSNSLVGEWAYEASENGQVIKLVYTFFKDKTYIQSGFVDGRSGLSSDGNYSQQRDVVILKPRMSSKVVKARLKDGKLILTMEEGGVYSPFQAFDVPLTKK